MTAQRTGTGDASHARRNEHAAHMHTALALARKGAGSVSPNPMVGALVVRRGKVLGAGYHKKFGGPHAEVYALQQAGTQARGADLYVTLEPCAHHGKTPPCADLVIASGIRRVFIGMTDPNPAVCGRGIRRMRKAGITVATGIVREECRLLNEAFVKYITAGRPLVTLKAAMTLDGKIATRTGDSRWITCAAARRVVHRLRSEVDAVMVGIGTVLADNPQLTARMGQRRLRSPLRIVLDSGLRIPETSRLVQPELAAGTLVVTSGKNASGRKADRLRAAGVQIVQCPLRGGRIDLECFMALLGGRGIAHLLIEGGATLTGAALRAGVVDKLMLFYAPKLHAGSDSLVMAAGRGPARIAGCLQVQDMTVRTVGCDILVEGRIKRA